MHTSIVNKSCIIFAPHPDDELIGCFSLLKKGVVSHVYYFFDLTEARKAEAIRCAEYFEFEPIFVTSMPHLPIFPKESILLVPSIYDNHPEHKEINQWVKRRYADIHEIQYYSIDMNNKPTVLPSNDRMEKELALKTLYPSQHRLFENEKYFLFEKIVYDESSKMIWITFRKEGIHHYPDALTNPSLEDVKFLGYEHRHTFHFKVAVEIFHDNRDIEFIQFKRWLESLYSQNMLQLNHRSCEMIADELSVKIQTKYPGRKLVIDVSEDNENGVTVEYPA